jgi:predicted CXXCH cytochrome family protein
VIRLILAGLLLQATSPCLKCHGDLLKLPGRHAVLEDCAACHEDQGDHTFPSWTPEAVRDLCLNCHDVSTRHPPPEKGACTACHDPHASRLRPLLRQSVAELCQKCHLPGPSPAFPHPPFKEGSCTDCHAPHGSSHKAHLVGPEPETCTTCHDDIGRRLESPHAHTPAQDECTTCHAPHGSDFPRTLKSHLSTQFYERYTPLQYFLCFQCYPASDLFGPDSGFVRNSENLHRVHVQRQRGHNCLVCHEPHGTDQPHLLRSWIRYGPLWAIPLRLQAQEKRKTCQPACHQAEEYGR